MVVDIVARQETCKANETPCNVPALGQICCFPNFQVSRVNLPHIPSRISQPYLLTSRYSVM